jgi:hypothetical protein
MNKDKLKNAIENIDRDLVSEARNYGAQNGEEKGKAKGEKGAGLSFFKPLAVAAVFLIFVAAGIAAAILIPGIKNRGQGKTGIGQPGETVTGPTAAPEDPMPGETGSAEPKESPDQTNDVSEPKETPDRTSGSAASETPRDELFKEETFKIEVMNDKLRFKVIACTPWFIADADHDLRDTDALPGGEIGAGRYALGHSGTVLHFLFDTLDGKNVIRFVHPARPLFALEARYAENDTAFNYAFCLYESHKALTVIDLNLGQEICAVALTEEEVAAMIDRVMPELAAVSSARLFEKYDIDRIDHIDVSSQPYNSYNGRIGSDADIGVIMDGICHMHALGTAGESIAGMSWILDICYEDGKTERIVLIGNREVLTSDGCRYSIAFKDISKLSDALENMITAR